MPRQTPTYPVASWKLTGPLAGQTFRAGEFIFVDGIFSSNKFSPQDLPRMDHHFEQWQAVRCDHGERDIPQESEGLHGDVLPDREGTAAGETPLESGAPVDSDPGQPPGRGLASEGTGSSAFVTHHPGDINTNRIMAAVASLDPTVDANWTQAGKPALDAVERALGYSGIKRADVEAACPGFVRPGKGG